MLKLGLIDSGPVAVSDWQAASDRLSDVTIVDADAADAVLVAGVDAANQATESGRHVLLAPGSLQSSEEAAAWRTRRYRRHAGGDRPISAVDPGGAGGQLERITGITRAVEDPPVAARR
ncbi:MAG: hypothetical protein CM1200mP2_11800 [Planctomycetaceae bacterium]|nr:MAG: hypothetical protein CM1200mP2_11800 [Planctomycetaceae bacterium]